MSGTPDPRSPEVAPPTAQLPLVRAGKSRHRAVDDGRRLMWASVAGAVVVVVAAVVMVAWSGDDGTGRSGPAAFATPGDTAPTTEAPVVEEATPSPTASPSVRPSPKPSARPGDLLANLQTAVDRLVRQREVQRDAGKELRRRLREVEERLADGEPAKAREKLREFAEKLVELRRENEISESAYNTLAAGVAQLAQALPAR